MKSVENKTAAEDTMLRLMHFHLFPKNYAGLDIDAKYVELCGTVTQ